MVRSICSAAKLYGNTRFDMASENLIQSWRSKVLVNENLVLTGEWFQSYPTFDYTSIYSVFAVDRYQEGSFRADYTINHMFAVRGAYKYQDFGENTEGHVFEAGLKVRPIETLMLDFGYDRRHGYAGDLDGFTVDAQYDVSPNLNWLAAWPTMSTEDSMTGDTNAQSYWRGLATAEQTILLTPGTGHISAHFRHDRSGGVLQLRLQGRGIFVKKVFFISSRHYGLLIFNQQQSRPRKCPQGLCQMELKDCNSCHKEQGIPLTLHTGQAGTTRTRRMDWNPGNCR